MTRCLLIDDDSQESRNLQQLLGGLGLDTAQAAQTDDALKYCNDNGPDVVMLAASGSRRHPKDFVRRLRRNIHGKNPSSSSMPKHPTRRSLGSRSSRARRTC